MKNIGKFWAIIAILAIIGLSSGCDQEVDPDDQIVITVTGLPAGANGKYAIMGLSTDGGDTFKANSDAPRKIAGGSVETAMKSSDGKIFGEKGNYTIILGIYDLDPVQQRDTAALIYAGATLSPVALVLGAQEVSANKFYFIPEIPSDPQEPPEEPKPAATDYGTYTTTYTATAGSIIETVVLSETQFKISDNSGGKTGDAQDQLTFKIEKWEITTPISGYTGAYKFTGKILSQQGYVPSVKTAPEASGFSTTNNADDVKSDGTGTTCWMYIYFTGTSPNITFVRSAFSRTGSPENKAVVTGSDNAKRVYTKSQ